MGCRSQRAHCYQYFGASVTELSNDESCWSEDGRFLATCTVRIRKLSVDDGLVLKSSERVWLWILEYYCSTDGFRNL